MRRIRLFIVLFLGIITLSGCNIFKMDNMEDISIITTTYPLEYVINTLYGKHALVSSIYPDGVDIENYDLKEKQLSDFSKKNLFVYAGFGNDKDIALNLLNKNKNLLIIDGSFGMKPNSIEELWLNPSNLLMVSQNIKNGLIEYINSNYLIDEINENYKKLELELSELDAEMKLTAENATSKTIVTSNSALKYLEKYGFIVIVLDDISTLEKKINEVTAMINNSSIKYIYTLENDKQSEVVKNILLNTDAKELIFKRIENLSEEERTNKDNYISLMKYNIELLKKETYK